MRTLFWISLTVIVYTYAVYPLLIALLARTWPKKTVRGLFAATSQAPISIVMAVHNGAPLLAEKLKHLLTAEPHLVKEVVVVSDGSTDSTSEILRSSQDQRLISIILPQQVGKAAALNHAIDAASADILLFVDIRPRIAAGALASMLENFGDPAVGCVSGELQLLTATHEGATAAVSGLYWKYEQWIRNSEALWDSPVGVYGGFYAARRSAVTHAPPGTILDDMYQPLTIIRQGYRSVLDRRAVVTDCWPATAKGEFARKVRTMAGNFQLLALAPWTLTAKNRVLFQFVSHKLLRLVVPYCLVLLLLSSLLLAPASAAMLTFACVQGAAWLLALVSLRWRVPLLGRLGAPLSALLLLNAAAVAGLFTFLFTRGPLWKIWIPTPVEAAPQVKA